MNQSKVGQHSQQTNYFKDLDL